MRTNECTHTHRQAYLALTSCREAIICLQAAEESCKSSKNDVASIQRRQNEILQETVLAEIMTKKHAMGFDDEVFVHTAIFSYSPYGALRMRPDRRVGSNKAYFSALTEGKAVRVRDTLHGRAVFTSRAFKKGELIFSEAPLVAASVDPRLCSFCTRGVVTIVKCSKCDCERYCSNQCRDAAFLSYHKILCSRGPAVSGLLQGLKGTELAATGHVIIALKLIAMIKQQSAAGVSGWSEGRCPSFDLFCSYSDNTTSRLADYACGFTNMHHQASPFLVAAPKHPRLPEGTRPRSTSHFACDHPPLHLASSSCTLS